MHIHNYTEIDLAKVNKIIHLTIPARKAQLGPPVGPALSQARVKAKDFCEIFNNVTKNYLENFPLRVEIFVFSDKRFAFLIKTPSIGFLIKNLLKKKKKVTLVDAYNIAKLKKIDLNYLSLKIIFKNVLNFIKLKKIKIEK